MLSDVSYLENYNVECLQKLLFLFPFDSKHNEGGVGPIQPGERMLRVSLDDNEEVQRLAEKFHSIKVYLRQLLVWRTRWEQEIF